MTNSGKLEKIQKSNIGCVNGIQQNISIQKDGKKKDTKIYAMQIQISVIISSSD